jgi:TfoX/Sxy family transcriptional regulator of competence genes
MASTQDLAQYIADQCAGAGEITLKKMFGEYGIYCNGKIFGLICDDMLFIKPTEAGRAILRTLDLRPPYPTAKDHFHITEIDDHEYLSELVRVSCRELPMQKPRPKKGKSIVK